MYNKGDIFKLNPGSGLAAQWSSWRAVVLSYNPHEHSVEVLREAGYSDAQISDMLGDGVSVDGRH